MREQFEKITRLCSFCGVEFAPLRMHTRFCGPRCRKRESRHLRAIIKARASHRKLPLRPVELAMGCRWPGQLLPIIFSHQVHEALTSADPENTR
jgi:hypothetical protein